MVPATRRNVGQLLAVDPGLIHPAAALFENGVLRAASRVSIPGAWKELERGDRIAHVREAIVNWALDHGLDDIRHVVYEFPQVYTRGKSKGDPNDLIPLAAIGAEVAAYLACARMQADGHRIETVAVLPAEWAGQTPKAETGDPWNSVRGDRVHRRLSAAEVAAIVASHDAIDGTGIGLHALGRFKKHRAMTGARRSSPPTDD